MSVYTLFVDNRLLEQFSADNRFEPKRTSNAGRSSNLDSVWLQQFTGGAGGSFFRVMTGQGEYAFARIASVNMGRFPLAALFPREDTKGRLTFDFAQVTPSSVEG